MRRSFSAEFKAQLVLQLIRGDNSPAELCRKHNLKPQLLANWKAVVLEHLHTLFAGEAHNSSESGQARVTELEQLVGCQALELAILKKASRLLSGPATKNGRSS
jgi:transposase-like protein